MSSGGAWTETEKVELLMSIVDTHVGSAIKWNEVAIPEGRTIKSCTHVIAKLRGMIRNGSTPTTPKKPSQAGTTNKRKRAAKDRNGDEDDEEEYSTPRKNKAKTRKKAGKMDADAEKPQEADGFSDGNDKAEVALVKDEDGDGSLEEAASNASEVVQADGEEEPGEYV